MDKTQILVAVKNLSAQNLISKNELVDAFEEGKGKKSNGLTKEMGLSEVLYFIGGFIVVVGIAVLIFQNWTILGGLARILVTLGFGVSAYFVGVLLNKEERYGAVGYAFHLIAGVVIPIGLEVVFYQAGYNLSEAGIQSFIAGILLVTYLASVFVFKKPIFTFFAIVFGTWLFFMLTNFMISSNPIFADLKFYEYRFLAVGVSYLFLGYYLSQTSQADLKDVLYGFGSLFFLGAALALGGWKPSQNVFWELVFPGIVSLILYLSVKLKSHSLLVFGTIFLMLYILKITAEYFSGTIGWPLSLMFCGVALIGVGYYAFTVNKKYLGPQIT